MTSGGDAYLAAQLATAVHTMVSAGEISCEVAGAVVTPAGAVSTLSGTAKGTLTCIPMPMQIAFLSAFQDMAAMTEGGNNYLAAQMAAALDAYLKAGAAATQGQGALAGSAGVGAIA